MLSTIHTSNEWWFFCLLSCHVWNESLPHWVQLLACDHFCCFVWRRQWRVVLWWPLRNITTVSSKTTRSPAWMGSYAFPTPFKNQQAGNAVLITIYPTSFRKIQWDLSFVPCTASCLMLQQWGGFSCMKVITLFSLAANSLLKPILLHLSSKLMMLLNTAVTG